MASDLLRRVGAFVGGIRRSGFLVLSGLLAILNMFGAELLVGAEISASFEVAGDALCIHNHGQTLQVSLKSPAFVFDEVGAVGDASPLSAKGALTDGQTLEIVYAPIAAGPSAAVETVLFLRWSEAESVLRKWASVRLLDTQQSKLLKEVILDKIDTQGRPIWTHGSQAESYSIQPDAQRHPIFMPGVFESHPIFLPGAFVGVEFPASSVRCEEGKTIVLAHRPGVRLSPNASYTTRTAVYGLAPAGHERQAFQQYIAAHRPNPQGIHVNYNSWWTAPIPRYAESDIVGLMTLFDENLQKARGVSFDSFAIDMGWSDSQSIWEIDATRFPHGFANIQDAARKMQSHLGLWISPSSYYPPALDFEWAKAQGFETIKLPSTSVLCLGGRKYAEQFKVRLADLVGRHGLNHVKLDGYAATCAETNHGHEPGELSPEAIAEGMIAALAAARKANPNVWLESTCFGWNPSPWWLFHVNSVIGTFGDDAPVGRSPSPIYRETYTTARDYFNLQGASLLPIPINAQEVLGIIHQSAEPLMNDAVVTVMRGHMFLPLYVNPKFMNDARWDSLAGLLRWARNNAAILDQTTPLLPVAWQGGRVPRFSDDAAMPREPYGYSHVGNQNGKPFGLVMLRNPWIAPQSYSMKLDESLGFPTDASDLTAVGLYPEPRVYGKQLKFGDTLDVALAPYETVVLALKAEAIPQDRDMPLASVAVRSHLNVSSCTHQVQRVAFDGSGAPMGPDWTSRLGDAASGVRWTCNASVDVKSPQAELLILYEGKKPFTTPEGRLTVDGREVNLEAISSTTGWSATVMPPHEYWVFQRAPLTTGKHAVVLDNLVGDDFECVSAWVLAAKPGGVSTYPNALPQPETISLDGVALFPKVDVAGLPAETVSIERPTDRIDGVFLDTLEPVSVSQGWGALQKNQSVWQKPMAIGGKRYQRGLGTHAPSTIVYSLDGKFRRFQSWAGADVNTSPTITFEVLVDGVKKWESGLMTRDSAAAWVDVDISGAKTLELRVGDAGDRSSDHADWAEARLMR